MKNWNSKLIKGNQGFTLIELLIVVVVTAILAAAAVPSYLKMVKKSRRGEAQTLLGAISLGESAFFSEFGTYGNNLGRMGIQMEGSKYIYAAGFGDASCTPASIFPGAPLPRGLTAEYLNPTSGRVGNLTTMMGRVAGEVDSASARTNCLAAPAITSSTYQATATGNLKDINAADCPASGCDTWTLDESRSINNSTDGT